MAPGDKTNLVCRSGHRVAASAATSDVRRHAPRCIIFNPLTAVFFFSAAVVIASLRAQLRHTSGGTRLASSMSYNIDGAGVGAKDATDTAKDGRRCTSVAFVPGTSGAVFLSAHQSGGIFVYHKVRRGQGTEPRTKHVTSIMAL